MNSVRVILDVDTNPPLAGLSPERILRINEGVAVARIPRGMASGKSAVGITATLPNGNGLCVEMSMANFLAAADALRAAEQKAAIAGN